MNAAAEAFAGDPFPALAAIELRDPRKIIERADGYTPWLASRCLHRRPGFEMIVCLKDRGHDGQHRSNPIPALEWSE